MTTDAHAPQDAPQEAAEEAAYLDLLLSDAALGVLRRFMPDSSMLRFARALANRRQRVAERADGLARELGRIAAGRSEIMPSPRDRRFADPAWTHNPLLRRILQAYLAAAGTAGQLLEDAHMDPRDGERVGFVVSNLIDAAAPSNNPLISPAAWKAVIDTRGRSAVRGARALARDLSAPPRVPAMVEPDAFEVGKDLAVTPGAVISRTDICELIQYAPATPQVFRFPLVIVPPMINKFYITDLAPGRSLVEYLVSQGHQVFVISWRNPDARHRDWGLDTYGRAVADSLRIARTICGTDKASLCGLCSGGILSAMIAADARRAAHLASLYLGVTVLTGEHAALIDERTAEMAIAASRMRGYLDGRSLAEVFAWLRPNDLIWNYWVNNYLQGNQPKPFDILFWNADTTRMPAALHRDFVRLVMTSALAKPGAATMLGSPVDLSAMRTDTYVVAGISDHLCPWQACYGSARLLGADVRFTLSTSGHIASMVNPPGNPKARFQAGPVNGAADEWLRGAEQMAGSWWPDYSSWVAARSGGSTDRPDTLGGKGFSPLAPAPGRYVMDRS